MAEAHQQLVPNFFNLKTVMLGDKVHRSMLPQTGWCINHWEHCRDHFKMPLWEQDYGGQIFQCRLNQPWGNCAERGYSSRAGGNGPSRYVGKFLLHRKALAWDVRTWNMVHLGKEMRSRTDCLLGTDLRIFRNVSFRDPWHKLDHYMILGCLHRSTLREHSQYLGLWTQIYLRPP